MPLSTTTQPSESPTRRLNNPSQAVPSPDARRTGEYSSEPDRRKNASAVPSRYQVLAQVGSGGTGIVYKVRDLETDEIVALKMLRPGIASDPVMQEGLRKEVCLARKVTHRNVCRIHEFNRLRGTACLSMEFVEGETLLSRIHHAGRLKVEDAIGIALQICAGLREAHAQGIVHRDLKPANVMLDAAGVVKIMDFGIARLSQSNSQMTGTIAGTPAYMAPEQLELKSIGPYTDIYALGLVLYEMVTGMPAFQGDSSIAIALKQIRESPAYPSDIVPALRPQFVGIISKCLHKDPAKRFQSVDLLCAALEQERVAKNDKPGWVSVELRVPTLPIKRVVDYGTRTARQAAPHLAVLPQQIRHAGSEAFKLVLGSAKKADGLLRTAGANSGSRFPRMTPFQMRLSLAALFVLCVGTFGWEIKAKQRPRDVAAAPQVMIRQSPQTATAGSPVIDEQPVVTNDVDLNSNSAVAPTDALAISPAAGSSSDVNATVAPAPETPAASSREKSQPVKSQPAATERTTAAVRTPPSPNRNSRQTSPASSSTKPVIGSRVSSVLPASAEPDAAALPRTLADDVAVTPAPTTTGTDPDEHYLDVGSFKDAVWADQAVDQLSRLGFHAVAVHKTHLWMQSYHVLVGPYQSAADIDGAEKMLTSENFTPHLVK